MRTGDQDQQGFELLADALVDCGVTRVHGLLGDANLAVMARAVERGVRLCPSRHESGAVSMAVGDALATGGPSVATVTRGPGFSNVMTALTSAVRDRIPMVLLAGDAPADKPHAPQKIDQEALCRATGARFLPCIDSTELRATCERAFDLATSERRPVVLNVPTDQLHAPAPTQLPMRAAPPAATPTPGMPDRHALERAAADLVGGERPVVLAGRGAVAADVAGDLVTIAERTGALLASTLPAYGVFAGQRFDVGFAGGYAPRTARTLLQDADVVLAVGAGLNDLTTANRSLFGRARIVHIDKDPAALGRHLRPDVALHGDAETCMEALADAIGERPRRDAGYRTEEVAAALDAMRQGLDYPNAAAGAGVDPRWLLRTLDAKLDDDHQVVVDVGHFTTFPFQAMQAQRPGQIFGCLGFAAVGLGVPTAIGHSIARPDRQVVAVVGDGGMLMSMADLETAGRLAARLSIIILNDHAYGAEVHHLRKRGLATGVAEFPCTDFAQVASALGLRSATIRSPESIDVLDGVLDGDTPALVDVHIDPMIVAERFQ